MMAKAIQVLGLIALTGMVAVAAVGVRYHCQKKIQVVETVPYEVWRQNGGRELKVGEMDFDSDFNHGQYRDNQDCCYFAIRGEAAQSPTGASLQEDFQFFILHLPAVF